MDCAQHLKIKNRYTLSLVLQLCIEKWFGEAKGQQTGIFDRKLSCEILKLFGVQ